MASANIPLVVTDYDLIIIGAGISGINLAYRIQTNLPAYSYTILEARGAVGGTWDLFRYPGVRSDSDLHTLGFPWHPWTGKKTIGDGSSIRTYVRESAEAYGIDKKIQFHHEVLSADWSSDSQRWALGVTTKNRETTFSARFIIFCTGYYDYHEPLQATIPSIEKFKGEVIHPQFWPKGYDYSHKKVIIIGSGATAVTLFPIMAQTAAEVTMLQRSPGYVIALPSEDAMGNALCWVFPKWFAYKLVRWKFLIVTYLFFKFCRLFPTAARYMIRRDTQRLLPRSIQHDPDFKPSYNPWEQRICVCPDGDFFKALGKGSANIVTDRIKTVAEHCITTASGKQLEADVIVTATGLKLQIAGGIRVYVDGVLQNLGQKFLWRGMMMQDLPNMAFVISYTNASWTLGADVTALHICRLLKYTDSKDLVVATPKLATTQRLRASPVLNLNSTYVETAKGILPKTGDSGPWRARSNYLVDSLVAAYGSLTAGMEFTSTAKKLN